jgi:hypothetical protein
MKNAMNLFILMILNVLTLLVIALIFKMVEGSNGVFLLCLIFGIIVNCILLPFNIIMLKWPSSGYYLFFGEVTVLLLVVGISSIDTLFAAILLCTNFMFVHLITNYSKRHSAQVNL